MNQYMKIMLLYMFQHLSIKMTVMQTFEEEWIQ